MNPEPRFRLNEADVIFERFNEEIVAIQLATGAYHSISGAGVDVFPLLSFEPTAVEIANELAEKYEAAIDDIRRDLDSFLEQLQAESLVFANLTSASRGDRAVLRHSGPRLSYIPPTAQPFRDLQELFLVDPVHDVGPVGWPQPKVDPVLNSAFRYQPKHAASMIFERFDEETVAMNLGTGTYHSLSGPAEDVFLLLVHEPTQVEIVAALRTKYHAPEREVSEATGKFLDSLCRAGLADREELERSPESETPLRQLALAKPAAGLMFVAPDLDTYYDHGAPAALQTAPPGRSPLEFARKQFRIDESGVVFQMAGSDAVIINFERGQYYLLNSSAASVLRLLRQQQTASELVDALCEIYSVSRRELTAAVLILLNNLVREGLLSVEPATEGSRHLELSATAERQAFESFSIRAFRELRDLFLPFPDVTRRTTEPAASGRDLVSLLSGYYNEVANRTGFTESVYRVADHHVKVRCAGGMRAVELGLALAHLETDLAPGSSPDFTIQVWDCVSGGIPSHPFLAPYLQGFHSRWDQACGTRGEVLAFHTPELPVIYHAGPDVLSIVDIENSTAYFLKRDESPLPYWEIGSPFRTILHYWLSTQSLQFVHGGAVGGPSGGVILAGKGGVGKSTAALACLHAGMLYAGDDYCAIGWAPAPYLHSLYNTAKLKGQEDLDRFPTLRDRVWNPGCFNNGDGDKATFFLSRWWPEQLSAGFPLRAVLVPQVTGERDTRLVECSEAQALLALAASTVAQLPMAGAKDVERLGNLVSRLPRYTLLLGSDIARIPGVIQRIL